MSDTVTAYVIQHFPVHRLDAARVEIARAQARIERAAAKAGQVAPPAPVLAIGAEHIATGTRDGHAYRFRAVEIAVTYARPVLDGWEFLAVIEPLTGGNLLRIVPGADVAEGELDTYRASDLRCDHCGTIRKRSETFIVRNGDGARRQVGRRCLSHFLGGKSAAAIIAALAWPTIISGAGEDGGEGGGREAFAIPALEFLAQVAACVRVCGWLSRGAVRDTGKTATADLAWFVLTPPHPMRANEWRAAREACKVTDADAATAAAALAWVKDGTGRSDYEQNLRLVAAQEHIGQEHAGILASAIASYNRHAGEMLKRTARAPSSHVGEIGKRIDLTLTIERIVSVDTEYGALMIHSFRDEIGNVFVWKTGKGAGKVGDRLSVRGTVKKHDEYRGEKQTVLSRCSISQEAS